MIKKMGYLLLTAFMAVALVAGNGLAAPADTPADEPAVSAPEKNQGETKKMKSEQKKKKKMKMASKKKRKKHDDEEMQETPSDSPKSKTD